jgi:hypothetical protein
MNIFVTNEDPILAARDQCNKHVVKMILESAQLLVTAFPRGTTRYKHTHVNHPCATWTRASMSNYVWLLRHACELCNEYTRRFGKVHKTEDVIASLGVPDIEDVGLTPFARAIKEPWKTQTVNMPIVEAYRTFYIGDKARFAKWAPRTIAPSWWPRSDA